MHTVNEDTMVFRALKFGADSRVFRLGQIFCRRNFSVVAFDDEFKDDKQIISPLGKNSNDWRLVKFLKFVWFISVWIPFSILKNGSRGGTYVFIDLETVLVGYFFARLKKGRIIFDVADPFALTKASSWPRLLKYYLNYLEYWYGSKSELFVVPSDARFKIYSDRVLALTQTVVIENVPMLSSKGKQRIREKNEKKTIGYFGSLDVGSRGLEFLMKLIVEHSEFELVVGGTGALEQYFAEAKHVNFVGPFKANDLPQLYEKVDFNWMYYDHASKLHEIAAPNKYYESLLFGVPMITTDVIPQGKIIEENGLGIVLGASATTGSVAKAIRLFVHKQENFDKFWGENYSNYYDQFSHLSGENR